MKSKRRRLALLLAIALAITGIPFSFSKNKAPTVKPKVAKAASSTTAMDRLMNKNEYTSGAYTKKKMMDYLCFNYDDIAAVNKLLKQDIHLGDEDGPSTKQFNAKLNKNKISKEKCNNSIGAPYRYQYFIQIWKKVANPTDLRWHTNKFMGTPEAIKTGGVDSYGYPKEKGSYDTRQKGMHSKEIKRIETDGKEFKTGKDAVKKHGVYYCICLYKADIKNWVNNLPAEEDTGWLYLQPVTELLVGKNTRVGELYYTLSDWVRGMANRGFSEESKKSAHNHYNHKIYYGGETEIRVKRTDFASGALLNTIKYKKKIKEDPIDNFSVVRGGALSLKKVINWNVNTGNQATESSQYYLVGAKIKYDGDKEAQNYIGFDYVINNKKDRAGEVEKYMGSKCKKCAIKQKTSLELHASKKDKSKKGLIGARNSRAVATLSTEGKTILQEDENLDRLTIAKNKSKDLACTTYTETKTGTQKMLAQLLGRYIHVGGRKMEVELIYDKVRSKITVQYEAFKSEKGEYHSAGMVEGQHVADDVDKIKEVFARKAKKTGMTGTLSLKKIDKQLFGYKNTDSVTIYKSTVKTSGSDLDYVLKDVKVQYYDKSKNKKVTTILSLAGQYNWGENVTKSSEGFNTSGNYWNGKTSGTESVSSVDLGKAAVANLMKAKSIKNVDFQQEVIISLQYFEPQIPAKQVIVYVDLKGNLKGMKDGSVASISGSQFPGKVYDGCVQVGNDGASVTFATQPRESGYDPPKYYIASRATITNFLGYTSDSVGYSNVDQLTKNTSQQNSGRLSPNGLINVVVYHESITTVPNLSSLQIIQKYKPVGTDKLDPSEVDGDGYVTFKTKPKSFIDTYPYFGRIFPVTLGATVDEVICANGVNYRYARSSTENSMRSSAPPGYQEEQYWAGDRREARWIIYYDPEIIVVPPPTPVITTSPTPFVWNDPSPTPNPGNPTPPPGNPGPTPTPTPGNPGNPTPTPEITTGNTPIPWSDPNAGKSWDKPRDLNEDDVAQHEGMIQGDKVHHGKIHDSKGQNEGSDSEDTYLVVNNPAAGSEGEIMLPNGYVKDPETRKYVANTLKSQVNASSYLTRGQVTKNVTTAKVPFKFCQTYRNGSYHEYETTIELSFVWFTLDELEIFKPNGARVYNYAFDKSDTAKGKADIRDPDGDFYETLGFTGGSWADLGIYKTGKGHCKFTGKYDRTVILPTSNAVYTQNAMKEYISNFFKRNMVDYVKTDFDVSSDTLVFHRPNWCPGEDEGSAEMIAEEFRTSEDANENYDGSIDSDSEDTMDARSSYTDDGVTGYTGGNASANAADDDGIVFKDDTWACRVIQADGFSSGVDLDLLGIPMEQKTDYQLGLSYTALANRTLDDLRVPLPKMSNKSDLFYTDGSKISQFKMNTSIDPYSIVDEPDPADEKKPTNESKVTLEYSSVKCIKNKSLNAVKSGNLYYRNYAANKVTLHTPIAMRLWVATAEETMLQNDSDKMVFNKEGEYVPAKNVALGSAFTLNYDLIGDFGDAADATGYGTGIDTKDYAWDSKEFEISFGFDVWARRTADGEGAQAEYHPANEPFTISDVEGYTFYPAYWAKAGLQQISLKVRALNTFDKPGTYPFQRDSRHKFDRDNKVTAVSNTDRQYYVVAGETAISVVGRLFGLRQYDVPDYPILQSVFRKGASYEKTDKWIASGKDNFLGQGTADLKPGKSVAEFPIVNGDQIDGIYYGAYKPGYVIHWNVNTLGGPVDKATILNVKPTFYWVPEGKGEQEKYPVKLYYNENVNGTYKNLVEIGSSTDKLNKHQLSIGDNKNDLSVKDLMDTAKSQGYEDVKSLMQKVVNAWTYDEIKLPASQAVCEGLKYKKIIEEADDKTKFGFPAEVSDSTINKCLQTWYGEYYLPNDLYVRRTGAVEDAKFDEDGKKGYDFHEDYWCKNGYLVVNFEVWTSINGKKDLLYDGTKGSGDRAATHLNMWVQEKEVKEKTDDVGQLFKFNQGDFIIYDVEHSMSDDFRSGGTH